MNSFLNFFSSRAGWLSVLAGLSGLLQLIAPVIPNPWAGLITAILTIFAYYHISKAVNVGKARGIKGL